MRGARRDPGSEARRIYSHDFTDSMILDIEPATSDDAPAIVEILRSSADWYEDIVAPEDFSEHFVDLAWARRNMKRRDFYLGRIGDEIAGTVSLQRVGDDLLYLGYVYLHTDHVGKGLGGRLLDFARDHAVKEGRRGLVLIAHPEADWACRAYLRCGFEVLASEADEIRAWRDGWLGSSYEDGVDLYHYEIEDAKDRIESAAA